jgi:hypothetical protein
MLGLATLARLVRDVLFLVKSGPARSDERH